MRKIVVILLFLLALLGRVAFAQTTQNLGWGPLGPLPYTSVASPSLFTESPASPSPSANVVETFEFNTQAAISYQSMNFFFFVATPSAGETADFGLYTVSGSTATLYAHTGSVSLSTTTIPSSASPAIDAATLQVCSGPLTCDEALLTGNLVFAMCSSSTVATVWAYLQQSPTGAVLTSVNPTGFLRTISRAFAGAEWGEGTIPPFYFKSPWASDSNWSSDGSDVCVNGVLPQTITLTNLVAN